MAGQAAVCYGGPDMATDYLRTLFLHPPSSEGFDGGAGSRYQAKREIRSFWYPTWLAQPAALCPGSRLIDAPPDGLTLDDIDLFEINEAFAVVAEKFIRDLDLDRDKVNVNGGSIALGHPIGATGSMLIGTILDELERRDLKRGLVTMCAAGGMAPAIIIERI